MKNIAQKMLLYLLVSLIDHCLALFEVNLTSMGLSYALNVSVGGQTLPMIVDTGNRGLTVLNINSSTINFPTNAPDIFDPMYQNTEQCLTLWEDLSYVLYYNDTKGGWCPTAKGTIQLDDGLSNQRSMLSNVTFQIATQLHIDNERLHDWRGARGNIGLGYCGAGGCGDIWGDYYDVEVYGRSNMMSAFQMLVYNVTGNSTDTGTNEVIGLDFNEEGQVSSMQVGAVKAIYSSSMKWSRQSTTFPSYHNFMVSELSICGINLMKPVTSYVWPAMVDTGQSCVQLPGEMYNSLLSWLLPGNRTFANIDDLPALTFKVAQGLAADSWEANVDGPSGSQSTHSAYADYLYIPLSSLLLPPHYFNLAYTTAVNVTVAGQEQTLCLLRNGNGKEIVNSDGSGDVETMVNPAPRIVIGSMALRSLYFAADYTIRSMGLANKLNSVAQQSYFNNDASKCSDIVACVGHQVYDYASNTCPAPDCDDYFFAELDEASQKCVYRRGSYRAGVVILTLCVVFEVISYLVLQYSSLQIMGVADPDAEGTLAATRPMNTYVDPLSALLGRGLSVALDTCIVFYKKHFPNTSPFFSPHEHDD